MRVSAATVLHRVDFELVPEKGVTAENKPIEPQVGPFNPNPIK
jgi:hypothetical protein